MGNSAKMSSVGTSRFSVASQEPVAIGGIPEMVDRPSPAALTMSARPSETDSSRDLFRCPLAGSTLPRLARASALLLMQIGTYAERAASKRGAEVATYAWAG